MNAHGQYRPTPAAPLLERLARVALGLYPAAWRERYGEEVQALLDDSGADLRTVAGLTWQAALAWAWPPRHLYDRPARMRGSVATVLVAWTMLAGLGVVFFQLTQAQGARSPAHPLIAWSYWVFDAAVAVSVIAVAVGGAPLWLLMMRTAVRRRSWRDVMYLCSPLSATAAWVIAVRITVLLLHRTDGVGPWWFLVLVAAGFVAACWFAAGPVLALQRLHPGGPAMVLAARAGGLAAAAMTLAGAASIVAAVAATLWAPPYAGYRQGWPLGIYVPAVVLAGLVATVGAVRGVRASRPGGAG
jgi:hypothetical protein